MTSSAWWKLPLLGIGELPFEFLSPLPPSHDIHPHETLTRGRGDRPGPQAFKLTPVASRSNRPESLREAAPPDAALPPTPHPAVYPPQDLQGQWSKPSGRRFRLPHPPAVPPRIPPARSTRRPARSPAPAPGGNPNGRSRPPPASDMRGERGCLTQNTLHPLVYRHVERDVQDSVSVWLGGTESGLGIASSSVWPGQVAML